MLIWLGLIFILLGVCAFTVDRRVAHLVHDDFPPRFGHLIYVTTDWAKGAHWLVIAILAYAGARAIDWAWGSGSTIRLVEQASLAFLVSLAVGSAILHSTKIILGRRRPRDELDFELYGFRPFLFDLQYDSFPSGHALTIFSVATILCGAVPMLAPLWILIALYLASTRVLMNSHFLSDVLIGAGLGILVTREVMELWFPALVQNWF
jgi:membrane-associated phospholipid phosphatase